MRSVASPFNTWFRGDSLEYHYFISVFREVVELKIDDSHGRLVRLLKYTEGEARDSMKHYIQQTPEAGYQKAKLRLERLGDIKCESSIPVQKWNDLDAPDILYALISKLPGNARDKWKRKVMMI